jgi:hypothetical protein
VLIDQGFTAESLAGSERSERLNKSRVAMSGERRAMGTSQNLADSVESLPQLKAYG